MTNLDSPPAPEQSAKAVVSTIAEDPESIRLDLVRLDADETLWRSKGEDFRTKARAELDGIEKRLASLGTAVPHDDQDLKDLRLMYEDLEKDYQQKDTLDLDSSLGQIAERVFHEIESAGIEAVAPEAVEDGSLRELANDLNSLGIRVEYVVSAQKADAPTVILFPQAHHNPGMSEELAEVAGVLRNQQEIEDSLVLLEKRGIISTVLLEGIQPGRVLSQTEARGNSMQGAARAKIRLGDKLNAIGFDDLGFARKTLLEAGNPMATLLRSTANNMILASNAVEQGKNIEEGVSALIIGAAHEVVLDDPTATHPFPLSKVLALGGANVIVANRPEYDSTAVRQWLEDHPEALQQSISDTTSVVENM